MEEGDNDNEVKLIQSGGKKAPRTQCSDVFTRSHTLTHTHTPTHTYTLLNAETHAHTHLQTHVRARAHTHTHTHAQLAFLLQIALAQNV